MKRILLSSLFVVFANIANANPNHHLVISAPGASAADIAAKVDIADKSTQQNIIDADPDFWVDSKELHDYIDTLSWTSVDLSAAGTFGNGKSDHKYRAIGSFTATLDDSMYLSGSRLVLQAHTTGSPTFNFAEAATMFNDAGVISDSLTLNTGENITIQKESGGFWSITSRYPPPPQEISNGSTIVSPNSSIIGMSASFTTKDGGDLEAHLLGHITNNIVFGTDGNETFANLHSETGTSGDPTVIYLGNSLPNIELPGNNIPAGIYSARRSGPNLVIKQISTNKKISDDNFQKLTLGSDGFPYLDDESLESYFDDWRINHTSTLPIEYGEQDGIPFARIQDIGTPFQGYISGSEKVPAVGDTQLACFRYLKNTISSAGVFRLGGAGNTSDFKFNYVDKSFGVQNAGTGLLPEHVSSYEDDYSIAHIVKFTGASAAAEWYFLPAVAATVTSGYNSGFSSDLKIIEVNHNCSPQIFLTQDDVVVDVNRARYEISADSTNGQNATDDYFPFGAAEKTHHSRLVTNDLLNGRFTVTTGLYPVRVVADTKTTFNVAATRVSYIQDIGQPVGTRVAGAIDGQFGNANPDIPATVIIPPNTVQTIQVRSVSSGGSQFLAAGASIDFIEMIQDNDNKAKIVAGIYDGVEVPAADDWTGNFAVPPGSVVSLPTGVDLNEVDSLRFSFTRQNSQHVSATINLDDFIYDSVTGGLLNWWGTFGVRVRIDTADKPTGVLQFVSLGTAEHQIQRIEFRKKAIGTSSRVGHLEKGISTKYATAQDAIDAGLLPLIPGTYTDVALNNPVFASLLPAAWLSGNDVVVPNWVEGITDRNIGADALAELVFQDDATAVNGLNFTYIAPNAPISTQVNGGGGNTIRGRTGGTSPQTFTGDDKTLSENFSILYYLILDNWIAPASGGSTFDGQWTSLTGIPADIADGDNDTIYNDTALAALVGVNTAKVGITPAQASEITANTAKVGITPAQTTAITANTAKIGITTAQANDITANNAKVTDDDITSANLTATNVLEINEGTTQVTVDISGVADVSAMTRETDGTIDHVADGTTFTVPLAETAATATAHTGNADTSKFGLSLGNVNKNTGQPATAADILSANPDLGTSYASMLYLFTSGLFDPQTAFKGGIFNAGGSAAGTIGNAIFQNAPVRTNGATIPLRAHGGFQAITFVDGGTVNLPDVTTGTDIYVGYTITLSMSGSDGQDGTMDVVTGGTDVFGGIGRMDATNAIKPLSGNTLKLRTKEYATLVWAGSWQVIHHNYRLLQGDGWTENESGAIVYHGTGVLNDIGVAGATQNIDFREAHNVHFEVTADTTLSFTNPHIQAGMVYLKVKQDATGGHVVTFPDDGNPTNTVPDVFGNTTLPNAANEDNLVELYFDGTNYRVIN